MVFSNCSSDNDDSYNGDDPEVFQGTIQEVYEQKFEKTFGNVHETCDWGFKAYEESVNNPVPYITKETIPSISDDALREVRQLFQNITTPNKQTFKWENFYLRMDYWEDINIAVNIKENANKWYTFHESGSAHIAYFFSSFIGDFCLQYPNADGTITTVSNYHVTHHPNYSRQFFIGFDIDGDNNYDDCIMSLWAYRTDLYNSKRPCCGFFVEETSNNPDFDFNDLVFNVFFYIKDDVTYIQYTVIAAGTTQPVYINDGKEIHDMFDVPLSKKINVGDKLEYLPIVYAERFDGELKVKIGDYTYDLNDLLYRKGYVPNVLCLRNGIEETLYEKGFLTTWVSEGKLISDRYIYIPRYTTGEGSDWRFLY